MAIAGPTLAAPSIVLSQDGKYLNTFGSNFLSKVLSYRYTFATGTWTASSIMATAPNVYDRQVAQDTDTGLVYLPGGYGNSTYNSLLVYDFDSDSIVKNLTIPALIPGSTVALWPDRTGYYSVVYTSYRQSLLFYGGQSIVNDTSPVPGLITEYVPATNTWSIANTQGTGPSHRALQCMVTNAGGTKIVVLGGALDTGVFANDLWVLDVPSMTWTQGPAASQARAGSACTIMNDTLINWGGYNGLYPQPVDLLLYSLKTNKFITEYKPTPPPKTLPLPKPTGGDGHNSTDTSSTGGSKNKGAVIGGSIASVVILAAIIGAGFFFYRRKRPLRWKAVFQAKDPDRGSGSDGQGKNAEVDGSYSQSTAPRLETALLGFVPSYRHGESGPEVVPMKEEFHEEEKQWWRGSNPSRPYPVTTGDKDEWMQKENARIATGFTNGFGTGLAAAANSPSAHDPKQQPRDSVLNSPDSVRTTTSSLVGTPSTLVNQLPYQQQQYQQQSFSPRYEQQQWPSPVSSMTIQQQPQPEPPRQPWSQQQQQQQQQSLIQQTPQGPVSPPPLNYSTRPRG
ncbi:hypothetical protein EMPS_00321 [Entomortierella parvispora]|uniref:Galactose oxidase n=1 Tax=Entomortierella parvispora TaxID=205924 RepID=A0A9P3LRV4_9FUNG|nr:hypothetical protein EMPS_00321 [Entomortierella parvispora]